MKHHIMAARRRLWVFQARSQGNRHAPDARTATAASNADGSERLAADEHSQQGTKDTTQAEGQQALTAQPALPPAQQTAQTADADQASTSHLPRLPRNPRSPRAPRAAVRTASNPRAKGAGHIDRQDGCRLSLPTRP